MREPVQREIVVRRGREFYEWKYREQNDSKFETTKIPTHPVCQKPARCKWCDGMQMGPVFLEFPLCGMNPAGETIHIVTPPNACHMICIAWCELNPNQPIRAGWLLTDEEKAAGKKGIEWPT